MDNPAANAAETSRYNRPRFHSIFERSPVQETPVMHARSSSRPFLRSVLAFSLLIASVLTPTAARLAAQAQTQVHAAPNPSQPAATNGGRKAPTHAQPVKRLLITNAMVIYGNAKPAY